MLGYITCIYSHLQLVLLLLLLLLLLVVVLVSSFESPLGLNARKANACLVPPFLLHCRKAKWIACICNPLSTTYN